MDMYYGKKYIPKETSNMGHKEYFNSLIYETKCKTLLTWIFGSYYTNVNTYDIIIV